MSRIILSGKNQFDLCHDEVIPPDTVVVLREEDFKGTGVSLEHLLSVIRKNILLFDTRNSVRFELYDAEEVFLFRCITDEDLSVRLFRVLVAQKVYYIWEIFLYTKEDILKFKNLGKKTWTELEKLLAKKISLDGIGFNNFAKKIQSSYVKVCSEPLESLRYVVTDPKYTEFKQYFKDEDSFSMKNIEFLFMLVKKLHARLRAIDIYYGNATAEEISNMCKEFSLKKINDFRDFEYLAQHIYNITSKAIFSRIIQDWKSH